MCYNSVYTHSFVLSQVLQASPKVSVTTSTHCWITPWKEQWQSFSLWMSAFCPSSQTFCRSASCCYYRVSKKFFLKRNTETTVKYLCTHVKSLPIINQCCTDISVLLSWGVRESTMINNVFTVVNLLTVATVVITGLFKGNV